jgi:hypothetical protein
VVIRVLAIIVEALLGLITVFALALMANSRIRRSQLGKDPASVTDLVDIMTPSISLGGINKLPIKSRGATPPKILPGIKSVEAAVPQLTDGEVRDDRELSALIRNGKMYLTVSECDLKQQTFRRKTPKTMPETYAEEYDPVNKKPGLFRPLEMTWTVAGIFIAVLLQALTSLVALHFRIQKHLGLPLPSKSPVVTNIVLNYILVVFATFLQPFWVLLNRLLCVLEPFEELRKGDGNGLGITRPQIHVFTATASYLQSSAFSAFSPRSRMCHKCIGQRTCCVVERLVPDRHRYYSGEIHILSAVLTGLQVRQ